MSKLMPITTRASAVRPHGSNHKVPTEMGLRAVWRSFIPSQMFSHVWVRLVQNRQKNSMIVKNLSSCVTCKVTEQSPLTLKCLESWIGTQLCVFNSLQWLCVSALPRTPDAIDLLPSSRLSGAGTSLAVCISSVRGSSTNQRSSWPQISEVVIMWNVLPQHVLSAVKCSTKSTWDCWREHRERWRQSVGGRGQKKKKSGEELKELNSWWQDYSS